MSAKDLPTFVAGDMIILNGYICRSVNTLQVHKIEVSSRELVLFLVKIKGGYYTVEWEKNISDLVPVHQRYFGPHQRLRNFEPYL